jgi:hypothetical protein
MSSRTVIVPLPERGTLTIRVAPEIVALPSPNPVELTPNAP